VCYETGESIVIEATFREFFVVGMTILVKTLYVISWHSVTYQELDRRFYVFSVRWLTKCHPLETRQISHRFCLPVHVFHRRAVHTIYCSTELSHLHQVPLHVSLLVVL
jgi:hypothetical protein